MLLGTGVSVAIVETGICPAHGCGRMVATVEDARGLAMACGHGVRAWDSRDDEAWDEYLACGGRDAHGKTLAPPCAPQPGLARRGCAGIIDTSAGERPGTQADQDQYSNPYAIGMV